MSEINEVRERLETLVARYAGGDEQSFANDTRALLADHARLQADAAKRAPDQPLCDLCEQREEVRSDAEGIGFCQECWDGWQAEEAKAVQP